jgi:1-acyl-sn-glycerol-3-phosphate acyltransferase
MPVGRRVYGTVRMAILLTSLFEALGRFVPIYLVSGGRISSTRRAAWLHASCVRVARRLSLAPSVSQSGCSEVRGLTVSNHLTYLDILVYGAARPFLFVAKSEVRRWPLLGILASLGGTIFVDRSRSLQVAQAGRRIEECLRDGIPVLLFPEGTSSDGSSVLPFRSPLFDPAIRAGAPVTAAAIRYRGFDAAEDKVTYWGEMIFFPHLFHTLCVRGLAARISFDPPCRFPDRKSAAREAWRQVQLLRAASDL